MVHGSWLSFSCVCYSEATCKFSYHFTFHPTRLVVQFMSFSSSCTSPRPFLVSSLPCLLQNDLSLPSVSYNCPATCFVSPWYCLHLSCMSESHKIRSYCRRSDIVSPPTHTTGILQRLDLYSFSRSDICRLAHLSRIQPMHERCTRTIASSEKGYCFVGTYRHTTTGATACLNCGLRNYGIAHV